MLKKIHPGTIFGKQVSAIVVPTQTMSEFRRFIVTTH